MSTHLIYSSTRSRNVPIGLVLGDVFLSQACSCFNPLANTILLRELREEDKNHTHLTDLSKGVHFTVKVNGRSDIGTLMGFSGRQCYHFTMKTWLILYNAPRLIANGNEVPLQEGNHDLFVQGDVRLVLDHAVCNVYLIHGNIYDNGKLVAQNKEHNFPLNMLDLNKTTECNWSNTPDKESAGHSGGKQKAQAPVASTPPSDLFYVGILKKSASEEEPVALVAGHIHRAPFEPYRFGKSKSEFELLYMGAIEGEVRKKIDASPSLITLTPKEESLTSLYSTSGHGFTINRSASVKICGQLLVVNTKDGSLVSRLEGRHTIEQTGGHLKIYVCDDSIILLDSKNRAYTIDGKAQGAK